MMAVSVVLRGAGSMMIPTCAEHPGIHGLVLRGSHGTPPDGLVAGQKVHDPPLHSAPLFLRRQLDVLQVREVAGDDPRERILRLAVSWHQCVSYAEVRASPRQSGCHVHSAMTCEPSRIIRVRDMAETMRTAPARAGTENPCEGLDTSEELRPEQKIDGGPEHASVAGIMDGARCAAGIGDTPCLWGKT